MDHDHTSLAAYALRALDPVEARAVDAHLAGCAACRAELHALSELEAEIHILEGLEKQAKALVASGQDRKWDELSKILQNNPEMRDSTGRQATKRCAQAREHEHRLATRTAAHPVPADLLPAPPATEVPAGVRGDRLRIAHDAQGALRRRI